MISALDKKELAMMIGREKERKRLLDAAEDDESRFDAVYGFAAVRAESVAFGNIRTAVFTKSHRIGLLTVFGTSILP